MKRTVPVLLAVFALLVTAAMPVAAARPDGATGGQTQVYLVAMADEPVIAYDGDVAGLPATKPGKGHKTNPSSANAQAYAAHLRNKHDKALRSIGGAERIYDYTFAVNGFAAVLTPAQAGQLRSVDGVVSVRADEMRHAQTDNSPSFLGLDQPNGLWQQAGGQGAAGEDVIVGVVDTGIWPEHPSFSDRRYNSKGDKKVYDDPPADWFGICQKGEQWNPSDCNLKLIGARYFNAGYIASAGGLPEHEYNSARDAEGHGTHTSSTAAGNAGVHATLFGRDFGVISGIAPRARVAMYKALWGGSGTTSDLAAAIDAAVADGVDVINYSIGSDTPALAGLDELAFLFAENAGVFVAVSNGNAGPGAGTGGSPASAPWVTAVGASTQDRTFEGTAVLGNGTTLRGASVTPGTNGSLQLVDSADAANGVDNPDIAGSDAEEAELCYPGELDPAVVSGNIVLCLRGVNARVDKSLAVDQAGGLGMILYNPSDAQALVTDTHWVPSVHVNFTDGSAAKAYIASAGAAATAEITAGVAVEAPGSVMADFSSRGPNGAATEIMKPDVTAPGVNILAGHTPTPPLLEGGAPGELFQSISGTSMSSPHVAGVGALIKQLHPDWDGSRIKSALMTTARQDVVKEDGVTPADPFDFGAGHIVPNTAVDPGLVYDAGLFDYAAFLCGNVPGVFDAESCDFLAGAGFSFEASQLNLASIAADEIIGPETITRTVTSVAAGDTTWTATVDVDGYSAEVPDSFTLAEGASETFDVTFTRTDAPIGEWRFGELVLTSGDYVVRSPIALRAAAIAAPDLETGEAAADSGELTWDVTVGYDGTLSANGHGLAADNAEVVHLNPDSDADISTGTFTDGVVFNDFTLTGAQYYAGGLHEDVAVVGDLDVFLFYDADNDGFELADLVVQAADGDSDEIAELVHPEDGAYRLVLHGWGAPPGGVDVTRHQWTVATGADAGSLVANAGTGDPFAVANGDVVQITAAYSGVTSGEYRGLVEYTDGTDILSSTVVYLTRP